MLGGVLVSLLVAQSRMTAQRARADQRLEACRLADRLLESWWADKDNFPRSGQGTVSGLYRWRWRTGVAVDKGGKESKVGEEAEAAGAEVVVLELRREGTRGAGGGKPALRIEVLLPKKAGGAS